ncbi:hypothetical protein Acr_00g0070670 [Actinidia rufa]|uniref:Uncharacterized protein n=1 Tax=Actinidia rufa TaxID=165716 RepID=A0A7J0DRK1_9ERIC|nr:hypothetical protein Acr_00g0070670 [Actinidia rufa]
MKLSSYLGLLEKIIFRVFLYSNDAPTSNRVRNGRQTRPHGPPDHQSMRSVGDKRQDVIHELPRVQEGVPCAVTSPEDIPRANMHPKESPHSATHLHALGRLLNAQEKGTRSSTHRRTTTCAQGVATRAHMHPRGGHMLEHAPKGWPHALTLHQKDAATRASSIYATRCPVNAMSTRNTPRIFPLRREMVTTDQSKLQALVLKKSRKRGPRSRKRSSQGYWERTIGGHSLEVVLLGAFITTRGHIKRDCPKYKAKDQSSEATATVVMAVDESDIFLAVSANEKDREVFSTYAACEGRIWMANNTASRVIGKNICPVLHSKRKVRDLSRGKDFQRKAQRKETKSIVKSCTTTSATMPKRVSFALDLISGGDLSNCAHKGVGGERHLGEKVQALRCEGAYTSMESGVSPLMKARYLGCCLANLMGKLDQKLSGWTT